MAEILSGSSTWTVPLTKDGNPVCDVAFYTELLTATEETGTSPIMQNLDLRQGCL